MLLKFKQGTQLEPWDQTRAQNLIGFLQAQCVCDSTKPWRTCEACRWIEQLQIMLLNNCKADIETLLTMTNLESLLHQILIKSLLQHLLHNNK
jgi:hypothetical protein